MIANKQVNLSNPCLIWIVAWGITTILMLLRLTSNIVELNTSAQLLITTNLISASLFWLSSTPKKGHKEIIFSAIELIEMNKFLRILLSIWAVGSILDIVCSGGLPIFWAATGNAKIYTDFGIPSFHGVMNACYLFSLTIIAVNIFYLKKNQKKLLLLLLCWPILILGRGILMSALVQICAVYLLLNRIDLKKLLYLLFILLLLIIIFGVVGDYRGTKNPFDYLLTDPSSAQIFHFLPNGFLWFYVYITTGLNNIAFSIDSIDPTGYPYYSIINLVPSFIRSNIDNYVLNESLVRLVDKNLNTSTFYSGYISDFGFYGAIISGFLIQLLSIFFYNRAKYGSIPFTLAYSVLFECIVFSIFYDMFLLLPYLLQMVMAFYLLKRCQRATKDAYVT